MKKLITLLLVLTGMVLNVSATSKRIYVKTDGNWMQWCGGTTKLTISSLSIDATLTVSKGTYGTWGTGLLYADIDGIPETAVDFTINKGNSDWTTGTINGILKDKTVIYWYSSSGSGNTNVEIMPDAWYLVSWTTDEANRTSTQVTLTDNAFAVDVNAPTEDTYYCIAPTIALNHTKKNVDFWDETYLPTGCSGNYLVNNFQNWNGSISKTNSYCWKYTADLKTKSTFAANISTGTFAITPYVTATLNANGYGTFGTTAGDYVIPAKDAEGNDVKAYYAASASSSLVSMTNLAAGTEVNEVDGLFLIGTASKTVKFTPASGSPVAVTNLLKRGLGENVKTETGSCYRYVFSGDAFKLLSTTGVTVPVGKAYLEYASSSPLANELTFSFDDGETTSIRVINTDDTTTKSNNETFNVAGQRVSNPTKGLYIVNGKKVMVK